MPKNPDSKRYLSPSQRGYKTIWVKEATKAGLDKAAKESGFATTEDYILDLHRKRSGK